MGVREIVDQAIDGIKAQREEILQAFIVKYGCGPDEIEQVEQHVGNEIVWYLRLATPRYLAGSGANEMFHIDDIPLTESGKKLVLEYLARKLWVVLEERSGEPDYYGKSYDPLVIGQGVAHSYVFELSGDGRHHPFKTLAELKEMLVKAAISYGKQRFNQSV